MSVVIAPIVEGHGDERAVPILLRLIAPSADIKRPVRVPKSRLVRHEKGVADQSEVSRAVAIARANIPDGAQGLVVLVIDADEDCAAALGPSLLAAMKQQTHGGVACFAAIAVKEFECWIVGGSPEFDVLDPERIGSPKRLIRDANGGRYKETADQPRFAARIAPEVLAERAPSFQRLKEFLDQFGEHPVVVPGGGGSPPRSSS